jgi:predicted RNA-binding Zn-ribbon protein involved in translation (DUF1610 family)
MFGPPPGFAEAVLGGVAWLITLGVLGALLFARTLKRRLARRRGGARSCMQCGYSLEGIAADHCPECGHDLRGPHATRIQGEPERWSRRARLIVLALVVWYPLLAPAYLIHVNEALHVWFCGQSWMTLSRPPSNRYREVTVSAQWTDLGVWMTGTAQAWIAPTPTAEDPGTRRVAAPLTVELPSMRAHYTVNGEASPRACARLGTPFILEWMRAQGVDVDTPPPPPEQPSKRKVPAKYGPPPTSIEDEAEAIRKEIERHDTAVQHTPEHSTGSGVFLNYSVGPGPWTFWTPRWYWPVAILLIAAIWVVLVRIVAPRA